MSWWIVLLGYVVEHRVLLDYRFALDGVVDFWQRDDRVCDHHPDGTLGSSRL